MLIEKPHVDKFKLDVLVTKAVEELSAGYAGVMISIGAKLGLYRMMAGKGPLTSQQIADLGACAERYVREWLNAQAAGGYVLYHSHNQTYELTPEQAEVLANQDSPAHIAPAWQVVASLWADETKLLEAFRTGEGIAWGDHDQRLTCGVAAFYRNGYRASLLTEWLPALEGVVQKLKDGALVADVGCGHGHSTLIMAQAFASSRFVGFDSHEESIAEARRLADRDGLSGRVTFERADASGLSGGEPFDLICFFDCLHDLGRPVEALKAARRALAPGGTLLLVEPFASDSVENNCNTVGRLYYAASTAICCAHAISEKGTHVLGAQAGPASLSRLCREAGFGHIREAARTPFNLILEVRA